MLHNMRQSWCKILEKGDKVTVGIFMLYFFRSRLNKAYITNHLQSLRGALFVFQFILSLKLSSEFVFLILQGTISHIFWGKRGHAFCSKVHCMVSSPLQS